MHWLKMVVSVALPKKRVNRRKQGDKMQTTAETEQFVSVCKSPL
jgi:hypothetical protein